MTATLFDPDAERALIGAALIDPSVLERVALVPAHFAGIQERRVWQAMLELRAEGQPLDALVIADRERTVTPSYMATCAMATPTADNAEYYADIVREHALTRAVLGVLEDVRVLHRRGEAKGAALLDAVTRAISNIELGRPRCALTMGQLIKRRFAALDGLLAARERGESALTGITTGIDKLDDILGGLQRDIVTILAGRPAMGKSALALGIADAATAAGHGVHVFSLEDAEAAYTDRSLARAARVPTEDIRTARIKRHDIARIMGAATDLTRRHRWLYEDVSDISAEELVRAVRRERERNRTELVIVDYLTLLRRPRRYANVHDAITQNLEVLARAAKHDEMAYLVLSQLNRSLESRHDRRPMLADLRESGSIEERAKCIVGLYRGSVYGEPRDGVDFHSDDPGDPRPTQEAWERRVDIMILKNSHGRTGTVRCGWDGPCTRVYE